MGDLTLRGPAYEWAQWQSTARVATADPTQRDSELRRLGSRAGQPTRVSAVLAGILEAALNAARTTGGELDPAAEDVLAPLRVRRGTPLRVAAPTGVTVTAVPRRSGWEQVRLDPAGPTVTVPAGVGLDLSLFIRAYAADRCASVVAERLEVPVLVALGDAVATGGQASGAPWSVLVQDGDSRRDGEPAALVDVPGGAALATAGGRWDLSVRGRRELQHLLRPPAGRDGRFGSDDASRLDRTWRSVTVVAESCVEARTWSTVALSRGSDAVPLLEAHGLVARLVDEDGACCYAGGWPSQAELPAA